MKTLRVGIAGIGFMGMIHYLAWQRVKGARVTAIASRDEKKLAGDWRSIKGNFGPPGERMDLTGIRTYADVDHLVNDPEIDLIDVCLPPYRHAEVTIAALASGRNVLCEKPIALDSRSAAKMIRAAETADRQLLVAHVLPFMGEFAAAYRLVVGGKYGRLLGGHFKRVISDPKWISDFFDPARAGGPMVDLHIHDAHFIRLLCGMPRAVFTTGRLRDGVAELFTSQFLFDDASLAVTATSGVIGQQGRSFTHGFEIHLERATLVHDFAVVGDQPRVNIPLTIFTADGKAAEPVVGAADPLEAFAGELTETVRSIRTGRVSPLLAGSLARDALLLCEKQTTSLATGRLVKI
ncbi:MAG TPA: Gfo/Idh/MocA family oxidoreductase [Pirellulales bacterium]|jgi:predicted dehydrogenase|nr:Gfo/Idh/MocA family oxidoreductase [Pirellulales bacterium]